MTWTEVVTAFGTVAGGGAIGIVGSVFTFTTNRRSHYDRVLEETAKLTTGSIAQDRNIIGKVLEVDVQPHILNEVEIAAFFNVLWMFERLDGLYTSYAPVWPRSRHQNRPQVLLLTSIRGAIVTWYKYSNFALLDESGGKILFSASSGGVERLHRALQLLNKGAGARPI